MRVWKATWNRMPQRCSTRIYLTHPPPGCHSTALTPTSILRALSPSAVCSTADSDSGLVNGLQSGDGIFCVLDIAIPILDNHVMIQFNPLLKKCQIMCGHFAATYHTNIGPNRYRHQVGIMDLRPLGYLHTNIMRSTRFW